MKPITRDEVEIEVLAEQDHIPVRGNAMASGDDAVDKEVEDEILGRLESGDVWAWAAVTVRVTWTSASGRTYSAEDHLGACSYKDEHAFRCDGYFGDMISEALARLNDELDDLREDAAELAMRS